MSPGWSNRIFRRCFEKFVEKHPRKVLGANICWLGTKIDSRKHLKYLRRERTEEVVRKQTIRGRVLIKLIRTFTV